MEDALILGVIVSNGSYVSLSALFLMEDLNAVNEFQFSGKRRGVGLQSVELHVLILFPEWFLRDMQLGLHFPIGKRRVINNHFAIML